MYINRQDYLNKLISRKHNGMVKVITGIRRCGKSVLLNKLFYIHLIREGVNENHIIRISLDDRKNKSFRDPDVLYEYVKGLIVDNEMYYVLLDEVQMVDEFEDVLNGFLHIENLDVYVTGSNAKFLSKDIITEFRGRGDEIKMYPLSFKEFLEINNKNQYEAWNEYIRYGGLPYVATVHDLDQKQSYLKTVYEETYLIDMINRYKIRNQEEYNELIHVISSAIGAFTNPTKLSNTFKSVKNKTLTSDTISKYIGYLEDSFFIESCQRYDVKGKKYINSPKKYYFMDMGIRNHIINYRQLEETHIMENIIYNELKRRGYLVDIGSVTVHEKNSKNVSTRKDLEIDFICQKQDEKYYVQSALSLSDPEKLAQEIRPFKHIDDSFKKIVIVKEGYLTGKDENGYLYLNLFDFLLNEDSLNNS